MRYTWNEEKAEQVRNDHGIDFARIIDIFGDPYGIDFEDVAHSTEVETRFAIIGLTALYGLVYLVYTETADDELHFITARRAEKWMTDEYKENRQGY